MIEATRLACWAHPDRPDKIVVEGCGGPASFASADTAVRQAVSEAVKLARQSVEDLTSKVMREVEATERYHELKERRKAIRQAAEKLEELRRRVEMEKNSSVNVAALASAQVHATKAAELEREAATAEAWLSRAKDKARELNSILTRELRTKLKHAHSVAHVEARQQWSAVEAEIAKFAIERAARLAMAGVAATAHAEAVTIAADAEL